MNNTKQTRSGPLIPTLDHSVIAKEQELLQKALGEFKTQYREYCDKNHIVFSIPEEYHRAIIAADKEKDIASAVSKLCACLSKVQSVENQNTETINTGRLQLVLPFLYTVTRLSLKTLRVVTVLPPVFSNVSEGVGLILNMIETFDQDKKIFDDYHNDLGHLEYTLLRLGIQWQQMKSSSAEDIMQLASIRLTTQITRFFTSALYRFEMNFFQKVWKHLTSDPVQLYEQYKHDLDSAIAEFGQAKLDLILLYVQGNATEIENAQERRQQAEVRDWLGVGRAAQKNEARIRKLRRQRRQHPTTLQWPQRMKEFYEWQQAAEIGKQSLNVLWLTGKAGVGKSMVAAVLIDILQSDSAVNVAYVFCQKGQTISEIVRILAYQFAINDAGVMKALNESCQVDPRLIEQNVELSLLLDNVLIKPMAQRNGKPLYVVLDGTDKVDDNGDTPVNKQMSYFDDLFECLSKLPSVNILVLCRPHAMNSTFRTNQRSIGYDENYEDIKTYVELQMKRFPRDWFDDIDPLDFFPEHSQGVFLWVEMVFERLRGADFRKAFQAILKKAKDRNPEELSEIFSDILSAIHNDHDKIWVKKSLMCVALANGVITLGMLQALVQEILDGDRAASFDDFINRTCGSLFNVIPQLQYPEPEVQLVHESFQPFILGNDSPRDFRIIERYGHAEIALACLKLLLSSQASDSATKYAALNWIYHLGKAGSTPLDGKILVCLRDLANSPQALEKWMFQSFLRELHPQILSVHIDEKSITDVSSWLQETVRSGHFIAILRRIIDPYIHKLTSTNARGEQPIRTSRLRKLVMNIRIWIDTQCIRKDGLDAQEPVHQALDWRNYVLGNKTNRWAEYIGKTCGHIWMSKALDRRSTICNAFSLSWKHYTQTRGYEPNNEDLINETIRTSFQNMADWIGETNIPINKFNMAIGLLLLGRHDESLRELEELLEVEPDNARILSEIGSIYLNKRQYKQAIDAFTKALKNQPTDDGIRYELANVYLRVGDREKAIDQLQKADPPTSIILQRLGDAYRADAQYDNAIDAFNRSLALDSHNIWTYAGLSALYQARGNDPMSKTIADRAVAFNRTNSWALAIAGLSYKEACDYKKAIRYYIEAIRRKPDCQEALKGLADTYILMKKPEDAVELLQKSLESLRDFSWIPAALGDALRAAGKEEDALDAYKNADRTDGWGMLCLADAYRANKISEKAVQAYQLSLDGGKGCAWPYKGLAGLLEELGLYGDAVKRYEDGIEALPNDYSLQISLGQLYTRIGEAQGDVSFQEAQKRFKQAMKQCPMGEDLLFAFLHLPDNHFLSEHAFPERHIDKSTIYSFFWKPYAQTLAAKSDQVKIYDQVIAKYKRIVDGMDQNNLLWCYSDFLGTKGLDVFEMKRVLPMEIVWIGLGVACDAKDEKNEAIEWYRKALAKASDNLWLKGVCAGLMPGDCKPPKNE